MYNTTLFQFQIKLKMKKAYLYNRVSKLQQATDGQGLTRQTELAMNFLKQFPEYTLADTITDSGKSGFYGKNLTGDGGLGQFIASVKDGSIAPDSLLVIEAPDRLSRLPTRQARKLITTLLELKINIAIVKYNLIVKHDEENDLSSDILLTVALNLAYRESLQKSERIRDNMKLKRDSLSNGDKFTTQSPFWLTFDKRSNSFPLKKDAATLIERIFTMKAGGLGFETIAKTLNSEGIINISGRSKFWNKTGIKNLITQRKVLGDFQPHTTQMKDGKRINVPVGDVIPSYFPTVISETLWQSANSTIRRATGGNTGNYRNLLRGLLKCPECGDTLVLKSKNASSKVYLTCNGKKFNKGCSRPNTHYAPLEESVIKALSHLTLPTVDNTTEIQSKEYELQQLFLQRDNMVTAISTASDSSILTILTNKLESIQTSIKVSENALQTLLDTDSINGVTLELSDDDRANFNTTLKRYVEYIKPTSEDYVIKFKNRDWTCKVNISDSDINLEEMMKDSEGHNLEFEFETK
ncbi:recombinase family protein [Shewanella sp. 202IG2-18]|uniref:recombinase family protein n=1 Tax=Parashewanella hymeniacidonis TaxID=2807618 RepID=UPI001961DC04|nr:recombinase family protein [Parashewanella hymeniacidonis]MBM7070998.1 recombinase family protein [Parashewanella hymeniacidonis]